MITIVSQPAAIFPAYNPALLVLEATESEADVTITLTVDGTVVTTHKREFFVTAPSTDSLAVFDLGKLARNYFSNVLTEINATENAAALHVKAYIDRRLCCPFSISIAGGAAINFTAVNAALGTGVAEADYSVWQGRLLSELDNIKYYEGFTDKSKLQVLFGTTAQNRSVVFIGQQRVMSVELEIAGTGASTAASIHMQVNYSTGGSYLVTIYEEVVGHTAIQAAQAMYDMCTQDEFLPALLNITHVAGTSEVKFEAIDWGYVTDIMILPHIESGFTLTETVVDAADSIAVTTEGTAHVVVVDYPTDFIRDAVVVNDGTEQTDVKLIEQQCLPASPFYVRWVNRIGGREHWMFSRRQTDKTDVDNSVTYDPSIETNADLGRFPRQISLTSEHTVVVGAEGIPNAEFDVLRRITTSPLIEYYDEALDKWIVVTVKSGATSKDTALPVQSIELEFTLPSPALQF